MKRIGLFIAVILLLTGCRYTTEEEWITGKIVSADAQRVSVWTGKVYNWKTQYTFTVETDNYNVEYPLYVSESSYVAHMASGTDDWMGVLVKQYDEDKFKWASLYDAGTDEEVTVIGANEIGTHDPDEDEPVWGHVVTVFPIYYTDGTVWQYHAYVRLTGYDGLYRVEVSDQFYNNFYFSETGAVIATLEKYYSDGKLTGTNLSEMKYID